MDEAEKSRDHVTPTPHPGRILNFSADKHSKIRPGGEGSWPRVLWMFHRYTAGFKANPPITPYMNTKYGVRPLQISPTSSYVTRSNVPPSYSSYYMYFHATTNHYGGRKASYPCPSPSLYIRAGLKSGVGTWGLLCLS